MAKSAVRTKDDDDDKTPVVRAGAKSAAKAGEKEAAVPPAGFVLGPLPEGQEPRDVLVVEPQASGDVAPGFTPGTVPGTDKLSAIETDTAPTYGTETPPRQTPPTNIENAMKHSPPSFHDSNGTKIASTAPTLSGIAPATAVAVTGAPLTVTLTGTNFDRATFATVAGQLQSQTTYVSATSLTVVINPANYAAGVVPVTAKNPAGESAAQNFTFT